MFKLIRKPEFTHDVPLAMPVDGGHAEVILRTRFRALPDSDTAGFDMRRAEDAKALLRAVVVRFEDLVDDDGEPVSHSPELRDEMLDHAWIRNGLVLGYVNAVSQARVGN